jgi:hypothetical protein
MVRGSPIWRGSLQSIGSMRWWSASVLAMSLTSACIAAGGWSDHALHAEAPAAHGVERTEQYSLKKGPTTTEDCAQ